MFSCLQVNWDSERECFDSFARETSDFYSVKKSMFPNKDPDSQVSIVLNQGLRDFIPKTLSNYLLVYWFKVYTFNEIIVILLKSLKVS